jgi:hypothetical protein
LADYHPDAVEFFDIGNHLELAERILARRQFASRDGPPAFNAETNTTAYLTANSTLARSRAHPARLPARRTRALAGF